MTLMKSLPMVARTKVLRRNTPEDWSVKDRTSCTENLHLGRGDDIAKIMQMEGEKCIITWGPTGAKGWPSQAGMGLGRSSQAGRPGPLPTSVRPPFPCTRRIFDPKSLEAPPFASTTWKTAFGNGCRSPLVTGNAPVTYQVVTNKPRKVTGRCQLLIRNIRNGH
jgi:hypothetical protein